MKIYGLLGKNIGYSLSPIIHNAAFKALNLDAEYNIFDVPDDELGNFFSSLKKGKFYGCNITVPYKERAFEFVDRCDELAETIGAINTVVRRDTMLYGYNTDHHGFIEALKGKNRGDLNFAPKGKSIFVFGAGGAGKAVIYGLLGLGVKRIAIADMDQKKAERLATLLSEHAGNSVITVVKEKEKYEEFISKSELLVNATPCGMEETDPRLFDYRYIHENLYIFELIYATETPLVKEARTSGAKAINGVNMLIYQAGESFKIWTGKEPPIDVMRKALLERIGK